MYNLTFDNPYNREIVNKMQHLRDRQSGRFVPTNIEPDHIVHTYDPITITGGARAKVAESASFSYLYPADLFEPRYTLNRNQMVGNKMSGGDSALLHPTLYPAVNYQSAKGQRGRKGGAKLDLGIHHSKRRGGALVSKMEDDSSSSSSDSEGEGMERLKKIRAKKGGKKSKNPCKSSKLLKIFN